MACLLPRWAIRRWRRGRYRRRTRCPERPRLQHRENRSGSITMVATSRSQDQADMFHHYRPVRALRSQSRYLLTKSAGRTKHGEAAFSHYAAQLWNERPDSIKYAPTLTLNTKTPVSKLLTKNQTVFGCFLLNLSYYLYCMFVCVSECFLLLCFHVFCEAHWVALLYEMCYINKWTFIYSLQFTINHIVM